MALVWFLTWVGSIFCGSGWVRSANYGLGLNLEKFPYKNVKFFNFFPFGSKKTSSGWVKKCVGQGLVGLLFTAGQKYAQVWSGPISKNRVAGVIGLNNQNIVNLYL